MFLRSSPPLPSRPPSRPRTVAAAALLLSLGMLSTAVVQANAAPVTSLSGADATARPDWSPVAPPAPKDPATPVKLSRSGLTVTVAKEFPQVVSYNWGGRKLDGQAEVLDTFTINGTDHKATTTMRADQDKATYTSTFADLPNLTITSTITVTDKKTVVFAVEEIAGSAAATVSELAIPGQSLVSVDSADREASLARTKISADSTTTADRFIKITGETSPDKAAVGTPYGFVSNSQLAAGIITNATDDSAQASSDDWNTRLQSRITDAGGGARRAELSVGNYTYAPKGAKDRRVARYELPRATVVLAEDANGDGRVDWQDGAIAYRNNMTHPLGADRVPERVVQHIPYNFASQATNPFLKTLDNVKRISMATDGLGQWAIEKGYASEGHDSAHPDYGGHENTRAGGLADLNKLIKAGARYNSDFAVHVNATEGYPQAKNFSEVLVKGQKNGWNWLNQAYQIDQRTDLGTGAILDRFRQLRKDCPDLKTVYIDVYYSSGWLADELASELHKMGFEVTSEFGPKFEGNSTWSHWANDKNYGPPTYKGINSNIVRFIANSDRDVWNVDPLLGGSAIKEFEGWTGQNDWNAFYQNIWTGNLPTKFLQHYQVMDWDFGKSATLTGGVEVKSVDGERQISMGDTVVLKGDTYLLPWGKTDKADGTSSPSRADKMYYYSASGGKHTFDLTKQFAGTSDFTLFELTDQGRVKAASVKADHGKVTLTAGKDRPYVLVPEGGKAPYTAPQWGEGTGLTDPGFNAGNLKAWNPQGKAQVVRSANGDNVARLGDGPSGISQQVTGLEPGKRYTLSANVEIAPGYRRTTTLAVDGGGQKTNKSFDTTPAQNTMGSDSKRDTSSQRASVAFTAPKDGKATLSITAASGEAAVTLDDVRVMADTTNPLTQSKSHTSDGTVVAHDDFEGNQPGWGPFVKGDAGGVTDPRTSISELHEPYSQKSWKNTYSPYNEGTLKGKAVDDVIDGHRSLKSHEENTGLVYRTVPATMPFIAGHKYEVSFNYQTNVEGQWAWVTGADTVGKGKVESRDINREVFAPALDTKTYKKEIVAGCGDTWVGLRKLGGAAGTDFVIDDFRVTDLGKAEGGPACASVTTPVGTDLSPGVPSEYVTKFTNSEQSDAVNVGLKLDGLPDGWKVRVKEKDGNLFRTVKPGATATTTWLLTPPADAAGKTATWQTTAVYDNSGVTKTVSADSRATVADVPVLPPGSMKATADSENGSSGPDEGPVSNVLDGDPSTVWHTDYTNSNAPYPHWVTLDLGGKAQVNGFGYLGRQSGGPNGRVKDYEISVSDNGTDWRSVAKGSLVDAPQTQRISFDPVSASYVRFTALNALNGQPFAAAAEMRVYGTPADLPTGYPPGERPTRQ
ncbi:endo-alpha-N-acetylgalactosaminidase family protein [Streptomyces sp. NPDC057555]|uniref:endo-alpha-N-acetylgalactosaminidase family protein n=1 Tax=Streptomyces sp. NPDC057555 TaxID=3346166 RepID=UPI00368729E4